MYNNKTIACIIPARMSSSRFPGKPLAKIKGREMFLRVADIAKQSHYIDRIIVATEDIIIQRMAEINAYEGMITSKHYTCTHRVAEVSKNIDCDYIFNLQGDEPLTKPEWIDSMIQFGVDNDCDMVQSMRQLEQSDLQDEDVVKMIVNNGVVTHMQRQCDVICDNIKIFILETNNIIIKSNEWNKIKKELDKAMLLDTTNVKSFSKKSKFKLYDIRDYLKKNNS